MYIEKILQDGVSARWVEKRVGLYPGTIRKGKYPKNKEAEIRACLGELFVSWGVCNDTGRDVVVNVPVAVPEKTETTIRAAEEFRINGRGMPTKLNPDTGFWNEVKLDAGTVLWR